MSLLDLSWWQLLLGGSCITVNLLGIWWILRNEGSTENKDDEYWNNNL